MKTSYCLYWIPVISCEQPVMIWTPPTLSEQDLNADELKLASRKDSNRNSDLIDC
jgi:hypothetical protein